uniref:Copper transport protein ATOX1 n=1 Tax=Panagrellus redivivus TaxID=6233 RepID=A0A7E4V5F8_PANRE
MSQVHVFEFPMTCENCAAAAKRLIGKLGDKVTDVQTDVATNRVTVKTDLPKDEVLAALVKSGKSVSYIESH